MSSTYIESPYLEKLAMEIIEARFKWPKMPIIKFLFLKTMKSNYNAKCSKAGGKWKYLTNADYVIEVWEDSWENMDDYVREALLYHELLHIRPVERLNRDTNVVEIVWRIASHDVEEFLLTVQEYGIWNQSLNWFKVILDKAEK